MAATIDNKSEAFLKEDYVLIAKARCIMTEPTAWSKSTYDLKKTIGSMSTDEITIIKNQQQKRLPYKVRTVSEIKATAKKLGITCSGRTGGGLIDNILYRLDNDKTGELSMRVMKFKPDPDQQNVLNNLDKPLIVVNAGPAVGKTTTIGVIIGQIVKSMPDARILVLAYNVGAADIMEKCAVRFGVKPKLKQTLLDNEAGCYVLTFHKYAYWSHPPEPSYVFDEDIMIDTSQYGSEYSKIDEKLTATNSFDRILESSVIKPLHKNDRWDYLIVDEAQDIGTYHAMIVKKLITVSKHVLIFGDPRQEINMGATWFSNLWAGLRSEEKFLLRYNHRSAPKIVAFINGFSKLMFPSLHHDQIADRKDLGDGEIEFKYAREEKSGDLAAEYMAKYGPTETYMIAPITIEKFGIAPVISRFKQRLHELKTGMHVTELESLGKHLDTSVYIVGTTKSLKGSERDHVCVIHSNRDYTICMSREGVIKALFVAISRARRSILVVMDWRPSEKDLLARFYPRDKEGKICIENCVIKPSYKESLPLIKNLAVLDDIVKHVPYKESESETKIQEFEPTDIPIINDATFIGCFAEKFMASALGVKFGELSFEKYIKETKHYEKDGQIIGENAYECLGIRYGRGGYVAEYNAKRWPSCEKNLKQMVVLTETKLEYALTNIGYSTQIHRLWTISNRLEDVRLDFTEAAKLLDITNVIFNKPDVHPIKIYRSNKIAGYLIYVPDFVGTSKKNQDKSAGIDTVVEMKHATSNSKHLFQIAIYAGLMGLNHGFLINTKEGTIKKVQALDKCYINDISRAVLMMKQSANILVKKSRHQAMSQVYVSVDIELCYGMIAEIGAIAFNLSDLTVQSVYHRYVSGVEKIAPGKVHKQVDEPKWDFERDTCLKVVDRKRLIDSQEQLIGRFKGWLERVSKIRTLIQWGGNDSKKLGINVDNKLTYCVDVYQCFRIWHENAIGKRSDEMTLGDVARDIFGPDLVFEPHRAFEDAVLCAGVFVTIINRGGTL